MTTIYKIDSLTFVDRNDDGIYQGEVDSIQGSDGKPVLPFSAEIEAFFKEKYFLVDMEGLNLRRWSTIDDIGGAEVGYPPWVLVLPTDFHFIWFDPYWPDPHHDEPNCSNLNIIGGAGIKISL